MPVKLDEFPIHQVPLSFGQVGTSDRNFYDRWYFNAHDRTGEIFLISGMGFYPNLGVKDAYVCVRRGDTQTVVRTSDAYSPATEDRLAPRVGPYRVEVIDPLHKVRVVCDAAAEGIAMDLTWEGSFPAIDEESHLMRQRARVIIDTWRFAQTGSWSGTIHVAGEDFVVDPDVWLGTRDRSWGIRPLGDPEPGGWPAEDGFGFWWLYVPLRFDEFAIVLIAQENGAGYRTLNDAVRVLPNGTVEQLGWPRVAINYRTGSRHPESARILLTEPDGSPLVLDVETLGFIPLHVGCGYGGDNDWLHGQIKGRDWVEGASYNLADPAIAGRIPWGVIDHVGRGQIGDKVGWGLFEHGTIGRHAPSGFGDFMAVAP